MNIFGKVAAGLTVVLALAATYLAIQVFQARSSRLAAIETAVEAFEGLDEQIAAEELARDAARSRFVSIQQQWGKVYDPVVLSKVAQATGQNLPQMGPIRLIDPAAGRIELGVGTGLGLAQQEAAQNLPLPTVHVYAVDSATEADYLGEFRLTAVDNPIATAELTRPVLPGETDRWRAEQYRIRTLAPLSYPKVTQELATQILVARQGLTTEQTAAAAIEQQVQQAQQLINKRLAELNGDGQAPADAPPEVANGLVATLSEVERVRDAAAARVANLRQVYRDRYDELETLVQQIASLVSRLPGA